MSDFHKFLLFLFVLALFYLALFFWRIRTTQNWSHFAAKHGLKFVSGASFGKPKVKGEFHGVEVLLQIFITGRGRNKSSSTHFDAWTPSPPDLPGLKIYKEGLLAKAGKAIGTQDIEIGDPNFDAKVMIKSDAPTAQLRTYLQPGLKNAILQLIDKHPRAYFDQSGCHYVGPGYLADQKKLSSMLKLMVACCTQANRHNLS